MEFAEESATQESPDVPQVPCLRMRLTADCIIEEALTAHTFTLGRSAWSPAAAALHTADFAFSDRHGILVIAASYKPAGRLTRCLRRWR